MRLLNPENEVSILSQKSLKIKSRDFSISSQIAKISRLTSIKLVKLLKETIKHH